MIVLHHIIDSRWDITVGKQALHSVTNTGTSGLSGITSGIGGTLLSSICASGVELFFMISGYLITASILRHNSVAAFLRNRAMRIYPVYLTLIISIFLCQWVFKHSLDIYTNRPVNWMGELGALDAFVNLGEAILFLPGVFNLPMMWGVLWTLSYEFFFYLLSAVLFSLARRRMKAAHAFTCVLLIPILYLYPRAVFFAVGAGVFALEKRGFIAHIPGWVSFTAGILFFVVMARALRYSSGFFFGAATDYLHLFTPEQPVSQQHHRYYLDYVAVLPGLLMFAYICRPECWCRWLLQLRVTQFLGTISYSLFLAHGFLVTAAKKTVMLSMTSFHWNQGAARNVFSILSLTGAIVAAFVSYTLIEKKFTSWLSGKLAQKHCEVKVHI
ncbi:MAG: acyltransferase [Nitrospirae bacterium]|nr:acyltransferase [Nitrospirota bacterium]